MKLVSITPFLAVVLLGMMVFVTHPNIDSKKDFVAWKSNQEILLLIENCQDGKLSLDTCKTKIPTVLDDCKVFHVLACDDKRLWEILGMDSSGVRMN